VGFTIDRAVFGTHLLTPQGDPEGLLGTLSSIATALVGAAVGRWLLIAQKKSNTLSRGGDPLMKLTVAGLIAVSIGLVWSRVLPLNKPLWTGSFALLSCGVATLLLAACARLPATNAGRTFNPMLWLGTNPLAIYFLSELTSDLLQRPWVAAGHVAAPKDWLFWNVLAPIVGDSGGKLSSLVYAVVYTSAWIAIAGIMRWRGIRLRV
jgi:predicted acyltransferase